MWNLHASHVNCSRMKTLYSLIESPFPPDFNALYQNQRGRKIKGAGLEYLCA